MRRALTSSTVVALACAIFLLAVPSSASADKTLVDACTKKKETCTAVVRSSGKLAFLLVSVKYSGGFFICVKPPEGKQRCVKTKFSFDAGGGYMGGGEFFKKKFPHNADGRYEVSFRRSGKLLGPTLHFNFR